MPENRGKDLNVATGRPTSLNRTGAHRSRKRSAASVSPLIHGFWIMGSRLIYSGWRLGNATCPCPWKALNKQPSWRRKNRPGISAYNARPSRQAAVPLQEGQMRSPGWRDVNSSRHIRHFLVLVSYSLWGLLFFFRFRVLMSPCSNSPFRYKTRRGRHMGGERPCLSTAETGKPTDQNRYFTTYNVETRGL